MLEFFEYLILFSFVFVAGFLVYASKRIVSYYRRAMKELEKPKVELADGTVLAVEDNVMFRCVNNHHVRLSDVKIIVDSMEKKMYLLCPHDYTTLMKLELEEDGKSLEENVREEAVRKMKKRAKRKAREGV